MNKQQAAQTEQALKNIALQLKENHDQAVQLMTNQLTILNTIATTLSETQRQYINVQTNAQVPRDDIYARKEVIAMIKNLHIKQNWTPHVTLANEVSNWQRDKDRLTLAALLKTDDGDPEMLLWILTFFTGEKQEQEPESYIERPVTGLIQSKSNIFQLVWRNVLYTTEPTQEIIVAIKDRMVRFAVNKYQKQENTKADEQNLSNKDKHSSISAFTTKYQDIFIEWTTQLLMDLSERNKYVKSRQ
jgi:hypothetical protein